MREAWALRDVQSDIGEKRSAISEEISDKPTTPQSLADRLRAAAPDIDGEELAERAAALQRDRAEEEHAAQGAERLRAKELEREREAGVKRERGAGHEL
jgi:hypothetical protein